MRGQQSQSAEAKTRIVSGTDTSVHHYPGTDTYMSYHNNCTHSDLLRDIYIYICMYVCVCVCMYVYIYYIYPMYVRKKYIRDVACTLVLYVCVCVCVGVFTCWSV